MGHTLAFHSDEKDVRPLSLTSLDFVLPLLVEVLYAVAQLAGALILLFVDCLLHFAAQLDQFMLPIGIAQTASGMFASVSFGSVNVYQQWLQVILKKYVVVPAAQASRLPEVGKRDATHWTGLFIQLG
jgi:hypothetical protein